MVLNSFITFYYIRWHLLLASLLFFVLPCMPYMHQIFKEKKKSVAFFKVLRRLSVVDCTVRDTKVGRSLGTSLVDL